MHRMEFVSRVRKTGSIFMDQNVQAVILVAENATEALLVIVPHVIRERSSSSLLVNQIVHLTDITQMKLIINAMVSE